MKRNFLISIFLLSFLPALTQSFATIKGQVQNPLREFILLHSLDDYLITMRKDTIKLSTDGSFEYRCPIKEEVRNVFLEVSLKQGFPVWIAKNQSLTVKVVDSISQPVFSGSLSKIHEYIEEEQGFFRKIYNDYLARNPELNENAFFGTDEYFTIHDSITQDRIAFLHSYFTKVQAIHERVFVAQQVKSLIYSDLYYKLAMQHPAIEKFKPYQTHFRLYGRKPYKFSELITFNETSLLKLRSYQSFSNSFFPRIALKKLKEKKQAFSSEQYFREINKAIDAFSKDKTANALLKTVFINKEIRNLTFTHEEEGKVAVIRKYLDRLKTEKSVQNQLVLVEQNLDAILEEKLALKKGTPAPELVLLDSSGNRKNLSDYKGKLLYVDVWASWCGPCIASFPYWNELTKKFAGREDVAFLIISIDDDNARWLNGVQRFKPEGTNLSSLGGFKESELVKKYNIRALPANILIDKEGRIIDAKAQRPESIDLAKYLR
jgi:thiol-disulfide isomerase/thioredoxin